MTSPVVYVAGAQRSGTTMAGQMLAASPDLLLAGEVRPSAAEPARHGDCDCGLTRDTCPFWSEAYAGLRTDEVSAATRTAYSLTAVPRILLALALRRRLPRDVGLTVDFLRHLKSAAGTHGLVDTSKTPVGMLLWRLAGERVHVVHCLRSPAKVAERQAQPSTVSGLRQVSHLRTYAVWSLYNGLCLLWGRAAAASYTSVWFGTLCRRPRSVADRVWAAVGVAPGAGSGSTFDYDSSHVLAGNPRRSRDHRLTITA